MKRSAFEITMEVLEIIERNSVPTRIMFAANMSWNRFMTIITKLSAVGLVDETVLYGDNSSTKPGRKNAIAMETLLWRRSTRVQRRYSLTEKGREVLSLIRNLNEKIEGLGIDQDILVAHAQ